MALRLEAKHLKKVFNRRVIFQEISFAMGEGETLLISGRNGSGKSTLAKILCGVLTPGDGVVVVNGAREIPEAVRIGMFGLVAPYLQLYEEFSGEENLRLASSIRGLRVDHQRIGDLLAMVGLRDRSGDPVRTYSSGMKQRAKYACALLHSPPVLILDEPAANLDEDGVGMVREVMRSQRKTGILIVATNDLTDVETHTQQVDLNALR